MEVLLVFIIASWGIFSILIRSRAVAKIKCDCCRLGVIVVVIVKITGNSVIVVKITGNSVIVI